LKEIFSNAATPFVRILTATLKAACGLERCLLAKKASGVRIERSCANYDKPTMARPSLSPPCYIPKLEIVLLANTFLAVYVSEDRTVAAIAQLLCADARSGALIASRERKIMLSGQGSNAPQHPNSFHPHL
jgi:hypothetical protein